MTCIGRGPAAISESRLQAGVNSARARRAERARIGEWCAAVGEIGYSAGIKECSVGRIAIVEYIVRPRIDLECLVDRIGCMQIEDGIRGQPLRLIGFVADKMLAADKQRVSTNLEC